MTETVVRLTCCGRVWPAGAMNSAMCGVTAKCEHNGKHYCKTHHPPSVQAKREARHAHYKAEFDERCSASDAAQSAADAQRKDAERWRDLEANWNAGIDGQSLHMWLARNCLRLGGIAAALDAAMAARVAVVLPNP